ncbi:MAG: serine/threonine protein kinase [Phycisphaerales bacterium]|nr:serine/threonine protein kinase [Phycisphaerales bacterium]
MDPTRWTAPGSDPALSSPAPFRPSRIGRYTIIRILGEGGMGTVYEAQQESPRRAVALKVIRAGQVSHSLLRRFEHESAVLGRLQHPGIAQVYEAGTIEDERGHSVPFFAMEFIRGVPLTEYASIKNLGTGERLDLIARICDAVYHAHQKGVIHRDLKPGNILVDEAGQPKVLDFGVARATDSDVQQTTLQTNIGQIIGTVPYMSPEQVTGDPSELDTRSDVYALGVIAYELLAGRLPYSLDKRLIHEAVRIIREEEPTRLSSINRTLRGDVETIIAKALEKDKARRYQSAESLASDIRRYLKDEPIIARPASTWYQAAKFARRNRGLVAGMAAAFVFLSAGLVVALVSRADAVQARNSERIRADELKKVADFQGQMLAQVDPTTAGVRLAEDIRDRYSAVLAKASVPEDERSPQIESFIGQFSRVNATDAALKLIDQTILKPAADAISTQFSDQPTVAATLRSALAARYYDLGMYQPAVSLEQMALASRRSILGEEHEETLSSIGNLAAYTNSLGNREEARPLYREAVDKSRRVRGNDNANTLACIANLGYALLDEGKVAEAEPLLRESLDARLRILGEDSPDTITSMSHWANLLRDQGKFAEAEAQYRDVLDRRRRVLGEDHLRTLGTLNDIGAILKYQGKIPEAIAVFREVVDRRRGLLGEMHPSTLSAIQNLGAALMQTQQHAEAESFLREALSKQQELLGPDHASTLITLGNFCVYLINQNKFAEAEPLCRETLERRTRILGDNHTGTLIANNVMGLCLIRQGRLEEGEPYWRTAQATSQRILGRDHPETLVYTHNLGGLAVDQKMPDVAEQLFREVVQAGLPKVGPEHPTVLSATRRLGVLLNQRQAFDESAELLANAEPAARKIYTAANAHFLAQLLKLLGTARAGLNQFTDAAPILLEAHTTYKSTRGEKHQDTRDCTQALIDFYTLWDSKEPGKGYDAKAAEWKTKLDESAAAEKK